MLHSDMLKRQKEFGPIAQEDIDVGPCELHRDFGILEVRVGRFSLGHFIVKAEASLIQEGAQEGVEAGT